MGKCKIFLFVLKIILLRHKVGLCLHVVIYIPQIDDTYMGWAVFEDDNEINDDDIYGGISKAIVPFTYLITPFVVLICIIALIFVFTHRDFSTNIFEQPLKEICQSNETQATFFALVLVSILITVYMFAANIILLIKKDANLLSRKWLWF